MRSGGKAINLGVEEVTGIWGQEAEGSEAGRPRLRGHPERKEVPVRGPRGRGGHRCFRAVILQRPGPAAPSGTLDGAKPLSDDWCAWQEGLQAATSSCQGDPEAECQAPRCSPRCTRCPENRPPREALAKAKGRGKQSPVPSTHSWYQPPMGGGGGCGLQRPVLFDHTGTSAWASRGPLQLPGHRLHLTSQQLGTSLVVQWLRLCTPNAGGLGSIPGGGTRSHMLQLRVHQPQQRMTIPRAVTKTWCNRINKLKKKEKETEKPAASQLVSSTEARPAEANRSPRPLLSTGQPSPAAGWPRARLFPPGSEGPRWFPRAGPSFLQTLALPQTNGVFFHLHKGTCHCCHSWATVSLSQWPQAQGAGIRGHQGDPAGSQPQDGGDWAAFYKAGVPPLALLTLESVPGIVGCGAACLAPTRSTPGAAPVLTNTVIPRHGPASSGGRISPR